MWTLCLLRMSTRYGFFVAVEMGQYQNFNFETTIIEYCDVDTISIFC